MPNVLFHLQFPAPSIPDQLDFNTFFESLDGWTETVSGGGTIAISGDEITLTAPNVAFAIATLEKLISYSFYTPSWDKKRWLKTRVWLENGANQGEIFYIITGRQVSQSGFGFLIWGNVVRGWSGNFAASSVITLETIPPGAYSWEKNLEAILYPGQKIEFYFDGVLVGTKTTHVPSGVPHAARMLQLSAYADNNAASRILHCSHARILQEI